MIGSSSVKPNILLAYVLRHDAPAAAGRTSGDAWVQFLRDQVGVQAGKRSDLEYSWLKLQGATGNNLTDLWASFLPGVAGITHSNELPEHIKNYFAQF